MVIWRFLGDILLLLVAAAAGVFAWHALDIHAPEGLTRILQVLTLVVLAAGMLGWLRARRLAWSLVGLALVAHLGWFFALQPSADRAWAAPLTHSTTGRIEGNVARLQNIRSFAWSDPDTAEEAWINGAYDLTAIKRVDLLTSVWDDPDIAHILVSFHFADRDPLAWSIEVRREADEAFSIRGGFLREFELALIAAPESDLIDLRVEARGETVRRFPTTLTPEQGAKLFRAYVDLGNSLVEAPRFYNTITANCTTVAWSIAHVLTDDDLPLDSRLLMSGRLPEYLEDQGVLPGDIPMAERMKSALIVPRAQ